MRSLGPGFRFHPTDVELIMYYLKRKVTRRKFHHDGIRELDVYDFAPWDLQGQALWKRDLKWYFFCPRERKYSTGGRMKRSTEHGSWRISGNDRPVHYEGEIVGKIKSLIFHTKNPKQSTNWMMHEYRLQDEYLKQLGLEEDAFVLCVIFEKEGPGPRNGAQYGGPYREADWDDDGDFNTDDDDANDEQDNHGEVTHGVGALADVHGFTDKGKSIVPNDRYCVASSSRTLQSHIDPSVTHGFPPTPVPGTLSGDSRLPSDEFGMFVHEVQSALLENEQAQDIDGVDQSVDCEPSFPVNEEDIYIGLEDICRLEDVRDSCTDAHDNDFLKNQKIPRADYMELADMEPCEDCMNVSGPFEGSHHHEPLQTDRSINYPQTGSSWFTSSNFLDSGCSELHMPYLDPCPPVSEGFAMLSAQGFGEYGPFLQDPQFPDGFGDNVPHLNQHHHFDGQGFEENVMYRYLYQHHQFAQGPIGFGDESLRENLTSSHGPEFVEDSTGLGGRSFGENGPSLIQDHQTADGFIGHEASTNGQMGHHLQPPQSLPSGSTHYPS